MDQPGIPVDKLEELIQIHQRSERIKAESLRNIPVERVAEVLGVPVEVVRQYQTQFAPPPTPSDVPQAFAYRQMPPAAAPADAPIIPERNSKSASWAVIASGMFAILATGILLKVVWIETDPHAPKWGSTLPWAAKNEPNGFASTASNRVQGDYAEPVDRIQRAADEAEAAQMVPHIEFRMEGPAVAPEANPPAIETPERNRPAAPTTQRPEKAGATEKPAEPMSSEDGSGYPEAAKESAPADAPSALPDGPGDPL